MQAASRARRRRRDRYFGCRRDQHARIKPDRIIRRISTGSRFGARGLVALVGVQSNQYPRAMDMARKLRAGGVQVCIGGFHVSGCLSMLPELPPELKEAMDLGVSLFAGEAEGRLEMLLRDAWNGTLKPLYNYMDDLPSLEGATLPILPAAQIKRTGGKLTSFDAGRGCPFQCSFCTIINVQGRKSRRRSADDVEQIIRQNVAQGVKRFFITDDNFARNTDWESDFRPPDRSARRGKAQHQVRHPGGYHVPPPAALHRESGPRRCRARLHRPRKHQPGQPGRRQEEAEQNHRVPQDAACSGSTPAS